MEQNWMQLMDQQNQLSRVMETNRTAQTYGLMLSEQDAKLLLKERIWEFSSESGDRPWIPYSTW